MLKDARFFSSDYCSNNPCENDAVCFSGSNGFLCVCPDGYGGETCSDDIDECESNPCQNGGECHDLLNGYHCHCPPAYGGDDCSISKCNSGVVTTNDLFLIVTGLALYKRDEMIL